MLDWITSNTIWLFPIITIVVCGLEVYIGHLLTNNWKTAFILTCPILILGIFVYVKWYPH